MSDESRKSRGRSLEDASFPIPVGKHALPDRAIVQRAVAQISWRSEQVLFDKPDSPETRLWYAQKTIEMTFEKLNSWFDSQRAALE